VLEKVSMGSFHLDVRRLGTSFFQDSPNYTIQLIKQREGGFSVTCEEVPEAITEGETVEEAVKNIKETLELVLNKSIDVDEFQIVVIVESA
jgi:predicted RNase H-like HicB family nuclease